ncbi:MULTISPECIES: hypothetical protein [unclassified Lentimicrobium]|uniref:hypothetical protein n=1 Tax=unclassified Lentimicrobium TaxID=2677434 RepID=UPI0015572439|nr:MULTISPECIES: hypothetical protein [unclassified Lentimicrobium]NPD45213.1 hypothetical protein [Lentimicrobium sp. S6]NPD86583.1 hypothetical protein [Lentimicrobium sp. L6]
MKEYILFLSLAFLFFFSSCEKKEEIKNENVINNETEFTFEKSQEELDARIELVNQPVLFNNDKSTVDLSYTWVANILPITSGGHTLSASSVDGFDGSVYVGWHARGENIVGELSVISLNDQDNPVMTQYASFVNQEMNDIEVKANVGRLFVAGQAKKNMSGASVGDKNAFTQGWNIDPVTGYVGNMVWENYLLGYSANSITYVANQTVWVSKGSQGGLTVFHDYDTEDVKLDMDINNAKHFDATGDYGVLLYGVGFNESVLRVWDMSNLYSDYVEYTIPYDVTSLGKNSVEVNYNYAYLAMGNDGIIKVDLTNGNVVHQFDYENGGYANGVYVDWRYIYAAYGADGLFVLDKETFEVLGNWNFDGSCNYVKKIGNYLYLANGDEDGLIVLRKN